MKPTVPEVFLLVKAYYAVPGNEVGGSLHIVLDDGNIGDRSVRFCIDWANARADAAGVLLGEKILLMSMTQRRKLARRLYFTP